MNHLAYILFFLVIYLIFALPWILVLWGLWHLLKMVSLYPAIGLTIFTCASTLVLAPIATQMATLYVGFVPLGWFLAFAPFEPAEAPSILEHYMLLPRFHSAAFVVTAIGGFWVSWKLFPISRFNSGAGKARAG